jgi:hypothetical protein
VNGTLGLAVLLAAASAATTAAPAAAAPVAEYLYVEANEGGSTGGHVALRLGEQVVHFQHQPPGIVIIDRVGYDRFRHQYADLENRSMHATPIAVSDTAHAHLLERFLERQTVQDRQLAARAALGRDRSTLETMLGGRVSIEAAGFFFGDDTLAGSREDEEPAISTLRRRIEAARGPYFLAERRETSRRQLASLDPDALDLPDETLSEDRTPRPTYGFPRRYVDLAAGLLALEVLMTARPLQARAAVTDDLEPDLALDAGDVEAVADLARSLEDSLVALIGSERPDWGPALLLGMARLAALRRTEVAARWVVVEALAPGPPARWRPSERPDIVATELRAAREGFMEARRRLVAESRRPGSFPELDVVALETAVGRLVELRSAVTDDRPLRRLGHDVHARPARVEWPRAVSVEALARGIVEVSSREERLARELRRLYGYNVMTRNCVTEILRALEDTVVPAGSVAEATRVLSFIPAVSAVFVRDRYGAADAVEIPSYRKRELARMSERDRGAGIRLRESNTLTSTVYRRNPHDSVFLFFTDDTIAARPLLGAANALVGLGASLAGLVTLPADGGETLLGGLRGVLFSLPELVFQNIRKGSFDYVPRPR